MLEDKIILAIRKAKAILSSVGLNDWVIYTNDSCAVVAKVHLDTKRLVYSKRYIAIATEDEFLRTTMHEAAHALLPYGVGHGAEFVKLCSELNPDKPYDTYCITAPIHRYTLTCPKCRYVEAANSKKSVFCPVCSVNGRGVYEMGRKDNDLQITEWASKL